jgi:hypothetical protein
MRGKTVNLKSERAAYERATTERLIGETNGVLRLDAAWVARDWLPPGRRLGLSEDAYDVGQRGFICERWLGSTTHADNRVGPADEGLSYVVGGDGCRVTLASTVKSAPDLIMGSEYAATHTGLGRLPKIYDYGARIPYHIHPRIQHSSRVGRNPKDEAYYFPHGVDLGPHPESFFGVHPWIAESKAYEVLLPYLQDWNSDAILQHSRGFVNVPGEGFHLPSGILHAPGTALTIELQEDSDCLSMFQALNAGKIISKELLFKDVSAEDRAEFGERYLLEWVDWEANGDPYFYENRHLTPKSIIEESYVREDWIYYNTTKFTGKRLVLAPGGRHVAKERGVYNMLVWKGNGSIAGQEVAGGQPGRDELLIVHDTAVQPHEFINTGTTDLEVISFFGPDINTDIPMIPVYRG